MGGARAQSGQNPHPACLPALGEAPPETGPRKKFHLAAFNPTHVLLQVPVGALSTKLQGETEAVYTGAATQAVAWAPGSSWGNPLHKSLHWRGRKSAQGLRGAQVQACCSRAPRSKVPFLGGPGLGTAVRTHWHLHPGENWLHNEPSSVCLMTNHTEQAGRVLQARISSKADSIN